MFVNTKENFNGINNLQVGEQYRPAERICFRETYQSVRNICKWLSISGRERVVFTPGSFDQ